MKLLILSRFDACGAGPRYRVYQYLPFLQKAGIHFTIKPLLDQKYLDSLYFKGKRPFFHLLKLYTRRAFFLLSNKSKFDLVLMDPELFPFLPFFIEKFFLPKKYLIDIDDAVFHTYDLHRVAWVRKIFGQKIYKNLRHSQQVIAGCAYLKEKALAAGAPKVSVLPTTVDAEKYKPAPGVKIQEPKIEICIGWVGSPSTIRHLALIDSVLIAIAKKKNISISVIGGSHSIPGVKTVCEIWRGGWNEQKEIELLQQIDIGIMPLDDNPWERGKCAFKIIKYMACGKPLVASAVGTNVHTVEHGKTGYLASSFQEWEKYLLELIEDAEKRKTMGEAGRKAMVQNYSLQTAAPVMCRTLLAYA